VGDDDGEAHLGLVSYDPALANTAVARSEVTSIDGREGRLTYRGYPIEELCERSAFLEMAYLLIYGELPTSTQLESWSEEVTHHTFPHENVKKFVEGFTSSAHPMGTLLAAVGALSTFYPEAKCLIRVCSDKESTVSPPCGCWPRCPPWPPSPTAA
jgi:citrate synthase